MMVLEGLASFIVGGSFFPDKVPEEAITGVEKELHVLRKRWKQRVTGTGFQPVRWADPVTGVFRAPPILN